MELLLPRLDPKRLVRHAVEVIRAGGRINYLRWELNGRLQFGHSKTPEGLRTGPSPGGIHTRMEGGPGKLPPSAYAMAHAVWLLERRLDAETDEPNIVETRVTPQLIRTYHGQDHAMLIAAHLGGPDMERFLRRQDWSAPAEPTGHNRMYLGGGEHTNRWLYLLAHLTGEAGEEFRVRHYTNLAGLADKLVDQGHDEIPGFLFLDLNLGERSPAARYWTRFLHRAESWKRRGPGKCMEYLVRMEPVPEVDDYAESWRQTVDYGDFWEDDTRRALRRLPPAKQREVLEALIQQMERDLERASEEDRPEVKRVLREFREALHKVTDETFAPHWMDILREEERGRERYLESAPRWLIHQRPEHPLVRMLAGAEDPELRAIVPPVLASHPTPEYCEMLQELLEDADPAVRKAAQKGRAEIKALKARPLSDLTMPEPLPPKHSVHTVFTFP